MRIGFVKCHGSGNDFALVDARAMALGEAEWAGVARALANRGGPVGSDGLLALTDGRDGAAFGMRMWNSDGSEAETCLNGLRCVARAGFEAFGVAAATVSLKQSSAEVARDADIAPGVYTVRETAGPVDDRADWLRLGDGAHREAVVPGFGDGLAYTAVAIPNPHLVAFVAPVDDAALAAAGAIAEAAPEWLPGRANISHVEVRSDDAIFVRTCERGVGLTDSCGSAMAASAHVAALTGRIAFDRAVTVLNRGGRVRALAHRDGRVTLSGNATWEWEGSAEVDPVSGVASDLVVERQFANEAAAWAGVSGAFALPGAGRGPGRSAGLGPGLRRGSGESEDHVV